MAVLKERARPYGYGGVGGVEEGEEVGYVAAGQLRLEKPLKDELVGGVAQCRGVEVVELHKLVEDVGAEHHRLGYARRSPGKLVHLGVRLYDVVEEGEATALASERSVADAREVGVAVKLAAVEHRHHADVFHVAVLHYGVEDDLAVGVHVLQLVPRHLLQKLAHGEDGPGAEPARDVVARDVVKHGVGRYLEDIVLQLLQGAHALYLLVGVGVAKHEVAEAHVVLHEVTQLHGEYLGVFVHEVEVFPVGAILVGSLRAFHDQRHILVFLPYVLKELESRLRVALAMHGEAHIADHAEAVVLVFAVYVHRLLIGSGEHHLGASPHAQRGGVGVECLGGEVAALLENVAVEVWEDGRVEPDGVFHKENHLHARLHDVVLDIHLVLYELDYRQEEVGVAKPTKHVIEDAEVLALHAPRDAMREGREHHAVDLRKLRLDGPRHGEGIAVGVAGHAYHEVYARGGEHALCLLDGRHLGERGRIAQAKGHILVVDLLLHAAIVLEHEGVVGIGHDEYIIYTAGHDVEEGHVLQYELGPLLGYIAHSGKVFLVYRKITVNPPYSAGKTLKKIACRRLFPWLLRLIWLALQPKPSLGPYKNKQERTHINLYNICTALY